MYFVTLEHVPNPDISEGYWSPPQTGNLVNCVRTLREASERCRAYIDANDLGAGNWSGGKVYAMNGTQVARVSYNGRVWDMEGSEVLLRG